VLVLVLEYHVSLLRKWSSERESETIYCLWMFLLIGFDFVGWIFCLVAENGGLLKGKVN
jgi:hypothetical protein